MSKVIVGRHSNGITINDLEWLEAGNGSILVFDSVETAKKFLRENEICDEELEFLVFRESIGTCFRCGSPLFRSDIEGYASQCFTCDEDFLWFEQVTDLEKPIEFAEEVILVELDYKGSYSRFALTQEEFRKEYPETADRAIAATDGDTDTIKPMVHIWFQPCRVGDEKWVRHFKDMAYGLPESDIEAGNLAYVDMERMGKLKKHLPVE